MEGEVSYVITPELAGVRADKALAALTGASRSAARRALDRGDVTLDGVSVRARDRVKAGAVLSSPDLCTDEDLVPEPIELTIVHQDSDLVIIDKPPGLVVHPGSGNRLGTLAAGILHRFPDVKGVGAAGRWGIVHRLDRDTSGLMVVALTQDAYDGLARLIRERRLHREYLTLVAGDLDVPIGTIDAPIGRDPTRPTVMAVSYEGRPARTHYTVERRYRDAGVTLARVNLDTGRTHQVRVHFASIGHPVVGDPVYGTGPAPVRSPRIFLHSTRIQFTHPVTGQEVAAESSLPEDLQSVVRPLGSFGD